MVVFSKELFYKNVDKNVDCSVLHYWEENCIKACISPKWLLPVMTGAAKFFLPIYLVKLLINYKKIRDMNFIKSMLIAEGRSVSYALVFGFLLISSMCLLRKMSGRIHYYNLLFFPGVIGSLSLLVESNENHILDTLIFVNSLVEAVIRIINFSLFRITKSREVLMFMIVSGMLMYLMENRRKKLNMTYFWFYTPARRKNESEDKNKICSHEDNCWQFSKEGFTKFFSLGYLINVIRKLIPKMGKLTKKPQESVNILINKSNVKFGLFIGSYVAVYRILTCRLMKWGKIKTKFHGYIAGFLSGLTYAISPNVQVLSIGITTLLQILYAETSEKLGLPNGLWPRQLVYMICHGILIHMRFYYPTLCPAYYKNMIDVCTNNLSVKVFKNVVTKYVPELVSNNDFSFFTQK